jgi:cardiolipin synthase
LLEEQAMQVPIWLFLLAVAAAAVLGLLLWSARTQRHSRVDLVSLESVEGMVNTVSGLTGSWFVDGNKVELLFNGDGFFPAFLDAIEAAEESIHIETFAWWKGDICDRLATALERKAEAGVEVRVLVDFVGSLTSDPEVFERLEEAGCRVVRYRPPELRALGRLNQRTHRKLGVMDARVGFVMGHGFASEWEGDGRGEKSWSDTGARVEGPVVGRLQAAFARNWVEETAEVLAGERYFPDLEEAGDVTCQVVASMPSGGVSPASLLHKLMIATANRELLIQNPYFCPDADLVELLEAAVERGVRVRVMVPGPVTDSPAVLHAGHMWYPRLLRSGIELWEFQPSLPHQKVLVVDGQWCSLGSMNFDERSLDINAEIALGVLDDGVCEELRQAFARDLTVSRRLSPEAWRARGLWHRIVDRAAYLIHEQL